MYYVQSVMTDWWHLGRTKKQFLIQALMLPTQVTECILRVWRSDSLKISVVWSLALFSSQPFPNDSVWTKVISNMSFTWYALTCMLVYHYPHLSLSHHIIKEFYSLSRFWLWWKRVRQKTVISVMIYFIWCFNSFFINITLQNICPGFKVRKCKVIRNIYPN